MKFLFRYLTMSKRGRTCQTIAPEDWMILNPDENTELKWTQLTAPERKAIKKNLARKAGKKKIKVAIRKQNYEQLGTISQQSSDICMQEMPAETTNYPVHPFFSRNTESHSETVDVKTENDGTENMQVETLGDDTNTLPRIENESQALPNPTSEQQNCPSHWFANALVHVAQQVWKLYLQLKALNPDQKPNWNSLFFESNQTFDPYSSKSDFYGTKIVMWVPWMLFEDCVVKCPSCCSHENVRKTEDIQH